MKLRDKTLLVTATLAILTITLLLVERKKVKVRDAQMRDTIADEGYETAGDILYPLKPKRRFYKLNLGNNH